MLAIKVSVGFVIIATVVLIPRMENCSGSINSDGTNANNISHTDSMNNAPNHQSFEEPE